MSVTVTGPGTGELNRLIKRVSALGDGKHRQALSAALATEARALVSRGFEKGQTPYGAPWLPPRFRTGQPGRDTGRLGSTASWEIDAKPTQFSLINRLKYAAMFNFGTAGLPGAVLRPKRARMLAFKPRGSSKTFFAKQVRIPARMVVPDGDLPPYWARRFGRVARTVLSKAMGEDVGEAAEK